MARSAWSRWIFIMLALVAGFASPGLAVAHGVAHAHGLERYEHQHEHEHEHRHGNGHHRHHHDVVAPHAEHDGTSLSEPEHGHDHGHARVEAIANGKPDVRSALHAPVSDAASSLIRPLAMHERPALSRWDIVMLARPAPNAGPPPALRAPPTC